MRAPPGVAAISAGTPAENRTIPALPGVVRAPDGSLKLNGSGEHRSALVANKADVNDQGTGNFGQTVPVDSIQEMDVCKTPFLAQYGRFTSTVVSVETKARRR